MKNDEDYLANSDKYSLPQETTMEDRTLIEQAKMIQVLESEEKNMVFKMVDTFLIKNKFKDSFQV